MVLIAAIPILRPATPAPDAPYIRASWSVVGDPGAILLLRLHPPGGGTFTIDLRAVAQGTSRLDCRWPGVSPVGSIEIFGFTVSGAAAAVRSEAGQQAERTFVLWINEPVPGDWNISFVYANRSDSLRDEVRKPISVQSTLEKPGSAIERSTQSLSFGRSAQLGTFRISQYGIDQATDSRKECKWL